MGRLGLWTPTTAAERLDRLESLAAIRQLPYRYALGLDSRDVGALADLFVPDVRVARHEFGRAALRRWFTEIMQASRTTIHLVANHIVDFDDADHARGIVYCRDQLERPSTGRWEIGELQYWDDYVRVDGEWCFRQRKFHRWYLVDALSRPAHGAGVNDGSDPLGAGQLPEAFPTWGPYWESVGSRASRD